MKAYITKDKFGLKYKIEPNSSRWTYFPNTVKDAASISQFFAQGGHQPTGGKHDPPTLDFRDENFKPIVYWTVSANRRTAVANFNTGQRVRIDSMDFATDLEIHDFLRPRCNHALEDDLGKLNDLTEQAALLTREASAEAITDLHKTLSTEMESYLSNHAKKHSNAAAKIEYTE